MSQLRILIAGGGIGGLAAAIALRRCGFGVKVFERATEIRAIGAGLTLQPNAIAALRPIGLADEVVAAGRRSDAALILAADGRPLAEIDIAAFWRQEPGVTLHRATLQRLLVSHLPGEDLVLGAEAAGCRETESGIRLDLADGRSFDGDLLIGADGLRSVLRRGLLGDGEPLYAGYYCWRGVCSGAGLGLGALTESWGRGQRFGLVPIDGGRVYWFAVVSGPPGGRDESGLTAKLQRLFAGWHTPIAATIAATPEAAILRGDILYRRPAATWGRGRLTLLGDAIHPMTPDLGQGACQAIEDAVVLAACLQQSPRQPVAALRRYEDLRRGRTAAIVRQAARLGAVAQWRNPLLASLRDFLNRNMPRKMLEKQISGLWRFPGPAPR